MNTSSIGRFISKLSMTTLFLLAVTAQAQTQSVPVLPSEPFNYSNPPLPAHFRAANINNIDTTPNNNSISDAGATLGRVLFYDKQLSANNSVSCSSCHEQARGFSDSARLSRGFQGGLTGRHSMGLSNSRYYGPNRFFWDERASSLEAQTLEPIQDVIEMGETLENVVIKLQATEYYEPLFLAAFGSTEINSQRIASSLAQFIRSMNSYRSKYDVGVASNFSNFSAQEQLGRRVFNSQQTSCRACHNTDLQILDRARNNGLDAATIDIGAGNGRFKSPSLRNVGVRAPFMHDGRFNSLDEVVNFYNSGVQNNPDLDNRLRRNGLAIRMNLSATEINALVAFLNTLTDTAFLSAPEFSDPFQAVPTGVDIPVQEINKFLPAIISILLDHDERE